MKIRGAQRAGEVVASRPAARVVRLLELGRIPRELERIRIAE